jgi:hypothetical protein
VNKYRDVNHRIRLDLAIPNHVELLEPQVTLHSNQISEDVLSNFRQGKFLVNNSHYLFFDIVQPFVK